MSHRSRGEANGIPRAQVLEAVEASASLQRAIAVHHDAFAAQLLQSSFCSTMHSAEHRVARWQLAAFDTIRDETLEITQDGIARALGLTRPTVTTALSTADATGVLQVERGRIVLLDRQALEAMACECHAIISRMYEQTDGCLRPRLSAPRRTSR